MPRSLSQFVTNQLNNYLLPWSSLPWPSFSWKSSMDIVAPYASMMPIAYNIAGIGGVVGLTTTGLIDELTIHCHQNTTKHYVSSSLLLGNICWRAINKLDIGYKYKTLLTITCTSLTISCIKYGPDPLQNNHTVSKTSSSLQIITDFFQQNNKNNTEIDIGTSLRDIAHNDYTKYSLLQIATNIGCFVLQKYYLTNTQDIYVVRQQDKANNTFINTIIYGTKNIGYDLSMLANNLMNQYIQRTITSTIKAETSKLLLNEHNKQIVIKYEKEINALPNQVDIAQQYTNIAISSMIQNAISMYSVLNNRNNTEQVYSLQNTLESYSLILLLKVFVHSLLSTNNIQYAIQKISKLVCDNTDNIIEEDEYIEQQHGSTTIRFIQTPESYVHGNIQEILKLGGGQFATTCLIKNIKIQLHNNHIQWYSIINDLFTSILRYLDTLLITVLYINGVIKDTQGIDVACNNAMTSMHLDSSNQYHLTTNFEQTQSILTKLRTPFIDTVNRTTTDTGEHILTITNYTLSKTDHSQMLHIKELSFVTGQIYAITGKIGTGKTTFLTDIAQCMLNAFTSTGDINYPNIPMIFCGTENFAMPKTSLLERVIYRLDEDIRQDKHNELVTKCIELFQYFQIPNIDSAALTTTQNDDKLKFSTGQKKICLIISALIYKIISLSPVLLILDETLANLDMGTAKLVFQVIKKHFNDSMIISVDHNAQHASEFYTQYIDLSTFVPHEDNAEDGLLGN